MLNLRQHSIERDRQAADLVLRALVLDAATEVALGADRPRGAGNPIHRLQSRAGQRPAGEKSCDDGKAAAAKQQQAQRAKRLLRLGNREAYLHDPGLAVRTLEWAAVDEERLILHVGHLKPGLAVLNGAQPFRAYRERGLG